MGTIVRGERQPFGPIINDTSGLAATWRQVGGAGLCRWKMLMNGMHLEGTWNCVEYVVIEPGAVVGEHVHVRTEEIYYIVSGSGIVTMNDTETRVTPGDLITAPIGAAHSIANSGSEDLHFFVVEMFPGQDTAGAAAKPAALHVPDQLPDGGGCRRADVDLTPHFTGDWRRFSLVEVPAGGTLDLRNDSGRATVAHLLTGTAAMVVEGESYSGGPGLSIASPAGATCFVRNRDAEAPLRLIVVEAAV